MPTGAPMRVFPGMTDRDGHHRFRRCLEQQIVTDFVFERGDRAISAGRVKTTWKYSTGNRSSARAAIQSRAAGP